METIPFEPYYDRDGKVKLCKCGCGATVKNNYVSGHNLKNLVRTEEHNKAISKAQTKSWRETRKRFPAGSKKVNAQGYVTEKVSNGVWKLEHTLVMEKKIGRKIKKGEVVHHIDGNRKNNRPSNLFLCRDRSHHNDVHRSQDTVFRELLAAGLVVFESGEYRSLRGAK